MSRWSRFLPVGVLLWAAPAWGSDTFPAEIQAHFELECAPPCTICHQSQLGGSGTATKPFADEMVRANLQAGHTETVVPALNAVQALGVMTDTNPMDGIPDGDADQDGVNSVDELAQGRNPNQNPTTSGLSDALVCGPSYGCGARVSSRPPVDATAFGLAVACAAVLVAVGRRRSRG